MATIIRIWHDNQGVAFQFDTDKFGISHDDLSLLIDELTAIRDEELLEDDDSILHEIALGLEDAE